MSWCVYKYMAIFIIMIFWNMIGTSACQQSQSILNNNISSLVFTLGQPAASTTVEKILICFPVSTTLYIGGKDQTN